MSTKRMALFATVCLSHAIVVAILIAASKFVALRASPDEGLGMELVNLHDAAAVKTQVTPAANKPAAPRAPHDLPNAGTVRPGVGAAPALQLTAPIDWSNELRQVANENAARQMRGDPYRSFSTHAQSLAAANHAITQSPGESQGFEGGEVISWISERCFYSNRGLLAEPYSVIPSIQMVCKDPPRRD
jgi:hypothetical protein